MLQIYFITNLHGCNTDKSWVSFTGHLGTKVNEMQSVNEWLTFSTNGTVSDLFKQFNSETNSYIQLIHSPGGFKVINVSKCETKQYVPSSNRPSIPNYILNSQFANGALMGSGGG